LERHKTLFLQSHAVKFRVGHEEQAIEPIKAEAERADAYAGRGGLLVVKVSNSWHIVRIEL
jgi:hypothetical protein